MKTSRSQLDVTQNNKLIHTEILKYTRAKSLEIYLKGPKSIEVNFDEQGLDIIVYEPYTKTEQLLLSYEDEILSGAIMTIKHRVCHMFSDEVESEVGAILNRKVRIISPEFNHSNQSIHYKFLYLD